MVGRYFVLHYFVSSFAIISLRKKVSWLLYFNCLLMSSDSKCSVSLSHGAVGWSTLCAFGVSFHYSFTFSCDLLSSILKIPTESTIRTALLYASRINILPCPSCYSDRNPTEHI